MDHLIIFTIIYVHHDIRLFSGTIAIICSSIRLLSYLCRTTSTYRCYSGANREYVGCKIKISTLCRNNKRALLWNRPSIPSKTISLHIWKIRMLLLLTHPLSTWKKHQTQMWFAWIEPNRMPDELNVFKGYIDLL